MISFSPHYLLHLLQFRPMSRSTLFPYTTLFRSFNETSKGWHVFGDYRTMLGAESFRLFKEIKVYRKQNNDNEECADIVADLINTQVFYNDKSMHVLVISSNVLCKKKHALSHSILLLAIS